jgi:hypothetical protein
MRVIIYVDGAVGVGKSTFIEILERTFASVFMVLNSNSKKSHNHNVGVLPEPLHRDWTQRIIGELGYDELLHFLLIRKIVAIENWSMKIACDGMQELENNVLIVERSIHGDRRVNEDCEELFEELDVRYTGESVHHIFISNGREESEEQKRLNVLYSKLEGELGGRASKYIHRISRPRHISSYYAEAAAIVRNVIGL